MTLVTEVEVDVAPSGGLMVHTDASILMQQGVRNTLLLQQLEVELVLTLL